MKTARLRWWWVFALTVSIGASVHAQQWPTNGLYRIVSGRYSFGPTIIGTQHELLPATWQEFIRLQVQGNRASFSVLESDALTVARERSPTGGLFRLSFVGLVSANSLDFPGIDIVPPPEGTMDAPYRYTISNTASGLRISGSFTFPDRFSADAPYYFQHTNVLAVPVPPAAIRVSSVDVGWDGLSNQNYQVQYRSSLTSNAWTNAGGPIVGSGSNTVGTFQVPGGDAQRFFRVIPVQ